MEDIGQGAGFNPQLECGCRNQEIVVNLRAGRYELVNTLAFTSSDSGAGGHFVTYRSYSNETTVVLGGKQVTGWLRVADKPYWVAGVPAASGFAAYFRQLYVNGVRAERAHSNWMSAKAFLKDPGNPQVVDGVVFAKSAKVKHYSNIADLRLLHVNTFKADEFPVTGITTDSASGDIQVKLQQPYIENRYKYGGWGPNQPLMIVNAFEELDEPGEWYFDRATQKVYYYPYSYEDMTTATVYAPVVETLVTVTGKSPAGKARNIRFQGIVFEHGNWFFPRDYFIGGSQAEILFNAALPGGSLSYSSEVPGQILLNNTIGIQFIDNIVRHQGSCGIQPGEGTVDTLIQGNIFYDLTGAAVLGGHFANAGEVCKNTVVANNVIRNIGMDFMPGTLVNNLRHYGFQLLHNDMADSGYMGFHQRNQVAALPAGGQGGTVVGYNKITMTFQAARYRLCDGGSIYSFGVWPDSLVIGNDVYDINPPNKGIVGYYQDNNSYGWTWKDNVARNVKPGMTGFGWVRHDAKDPNVNKGIGNCTDATVVVAAHLASSVDYTTFPLGSPSPHAQEIIKAAGLEPGYAHLLSHIYSGTNLAQGKHAWASSEEGSVHAASKAVDWDYATMWQSAPNDNDCWWVVDLWRTLCDSAARTGAAL